jgi:hypothetical protein
MSTLITLHRICSKAKCPILIFFFLHFGQRWWNQQANTGVSGISTLLTLSLPLRSQCTASVPRAARALVVVDIGLGNLDLTVGTERVRGQTMTVTVTN